MFDQLDLRSFLNAAFRQSRKFLMVACSILLVGLLYLLFATPTYQSQSELLVKFGQDARPEATADPRGGSLSAEEKRGLVASNLNILTSRDLLGKLLQDISIEKAYPKLAATPPSGMPVQEAAINKLAKDITTKTEPDAGIITVGLYNSDPQQAQAMLSHLVDLFLDRQSEIYANPQSAVLKEQAATALTDLEAANKALYEYKTSNGLTSIDEELTLLLKQRGDLAGYLSRRESTDSTGTTTTTSTALPSRMAMNGDISRFPVIDDAQKRIDELRGQEQQLLQTYNSNSPLVQNIRRSIVAENAALNRSTAVLNQQIASLDQQIASKHRLKLDFEDLTRRVSYAAEAYKNAQDRLQTAEINNDLNQRKITRISVIEAPNLPYKATRPNVPLVLIMTLLVAGLLGAAAAAMAQILDQRFSRWEQLFAKFGIPVLASFNRPDPKATSIALSPAELATLYAAVAGKITPSQSTTVCIASSYAGEGCTTVGLALAKYAGNNFGIRTLLVSETHEQLRQALEPRLPTVTLGQSGPESLAQAVVASTANASVAIMFDKSPTDLSAAMLDNVNRSLAALKQSYGLVILAMPALVTIAAKIEFARMADSSMLLVEAERLRAPVVKQAIELFTNARIPLLGLIFNKQRLHIPTWIYRRL